MKKYENRDHGELFAHTKSSEKYVVNDGDWFDQI